MISEEREEQNNTRREVSGSERRTEQNNLPVMIVAWIVGLATAAGATTLAYPLIENYLEVFGNRSSEPLYSTLLNGAAFFVAAASARLGFRSAVIKKEEKKEKEKENKVGPAPTPPTE